ncbi:MAG: efflux RND transporter permease subunit, partial [Gemmatimonadota bacterium]
MFLPDKSIDRPVLTVVVMAAIVLIGWVGYRSLAVRELPDIDFPIVSVTTILPGASPEVVETEVTEVLEEEINTIEGIKTLTSISGEQTSIVTAEFDLSRDVDFALQDVRTKVSRIRGELPDDVEDPIVDKLDPDAFPIIWIAIQNPNADIVEINEVADDLVKERIQTLPGVGSVMLGGSRRFAVRIRLDPQRMAAYGLTVGDVQLALQMGNIEIPSGRIESETREFTVRTLGELATPE